MRHNWSMLLQEVLDAQTAHIPRYLAPQGLTRALIEEISQVKGDPAWMREKRLRAFLLFQEAKIPDWGPSLAGLG